MHFFSEHYCFCTDVDQVVWRSINNAGQVKRFLIFKESSTQLRGSLLAQIKFLRFFLGSPLDSDIELVLILAGSSVPGQGTGYGAQVDSAHGTYISW